MEEGEDKKLDFVGSNPGAVRHGNFINYYEFHPAQERLQNLPTNLWTLESTDKSKFVALDIGCNTGVRMQLKSKLIINHFEFFRT
jgi:hypothetical protein